MLRFLTILMVTLNIPYSFSGMEMQIMNSKIQILRFDGQCKRSPDTAITLELTGWRVEGKSLVLNQTMLVKREVTDVSLRINVQKCRSKENPDSCQNVYDLVNKNACHIFEAKSKLWSPLFSKMEPEWKCPLHKGLYIQTEGKFDISPVLYLPIDGWYWKADAEYIDKDGKILLCIDICAKVTRL